MSNKFFRLHSSCFLTRGIAGSIICNTSHLSYLDIPNILCDILEVNSSNNYSVPELKLHFDGAYNDGIDKFFDHFVSINYGQYVGNKNNFAPLELDYKYPSYFSNCVLELPIDNFQNIENLFQEISLLGIRFLEIRIVDLELPLLTLNYFFELLSRFEFRGVNLILPYSLIFEKVITDLCIKYSKICSIFFYSSPGTKNTNLTINEYAIPLFYRKTHLENSGHDKKSKDSFTLNIDVFTESQTYNTGLNGKISIDRNGYIKNYLSHSKIYGCILEDSLTKVALSSSFSECWHYNNDLIEICKDCQYRYICVDTDEIKIVNSKLTKTNNCNFNPYTHEWSN